MDNGINLGQQSFVKELVSLVHDQKLGIGEADTLSLQGPGQTQGSCQQYIHLHIIQLSYAATSYQNSEIQPIFG